MTQQEREMSEEQDRGGLDDRLRTLAFVLVSEDRIEDGEAVAAAADLLQRRDDFRAAATDWQATASIRYEQAVRAEQRQKELEEGLREALLWIESQPDGDDGTKGMVEYRLRTLLTRLEEMGGWSEKVYIERLPDGSDVYPPQGPSIEERRRRRWRWLVRWLPFRRFKTWQWRGDWPLLSDEEIKMSHSPTGDRAYDERHPGEVEDCDLCTPMTPEEMGPNWIAEGDAYAARLWEAAPSLVALLEEIVKWDLAEGGLYDAEHMVTVYERARSLLTSLSKGNDAALTTSEESRRCQGCEDAPVGQHTGPHDWERATSEESR